MKTPEEFYKATNGVELDKHDKRALLFTYYDMMGFAEEYASQHKGTKQIDYE